jgi:hypothetical protein
MKILKRILKKHTRYYVDKEKGIIIAKAYAPYPLKEVCNQVVGKWVYAEKLIPKNLEYITEKATVCPEDEWDEEYGKKIALEKLYKRKFKALVGTMFNNYLNKSLNSEVNIIITMESDTNC